MTDARPEPTTLTDELAEGYASFLSVPLHVLAAASATEAVRKVKLVDCDRYRDRGCYTGSYHRPLTQCFRSD